VLAAAYLALNQRGEGESPSDPTCTRDVTAACLLAMQDVRVRLPRGALVQDVGKPGNPPVLGTGKRGFKSHRPDCLRCGRMVRRLLVKETIAGSIPAAAARTEGQADGRRHVDLHTHTKKWYFRGMKPAKVLYDIHRLSIALANSGNFSDAIRFFGLEPTGKRIEIVKKLIAQHGLFFGQPSRNPRGRGYDLERGYGRFSRAELEEAVGNVTSIVSLMLRLGMNPRFGNSYQALSKRLVDLGIDTTHFTGSSWMKGTISNRRKSAKEILRGKRSGGRKTPTYMLRRALVEVGVPCVCAECGRKPFWQGKPLVLQVDHRDGETLNDEQGNLRFLCPNCHSQTENYGNRKTAER
jgi:hypothetical protein